jgi:hypothetical protein
VLSVLMLNAMPAYPSLPPKHNAHPTLVWCAVICVRATGAGAGRTGQGLDDKVAR